MLEIIFMICLSASSVDSVKMTRTKNAIFISDIQIHAAILIILSPIQNELELENSKNHTALKVFEHCKIKFTEVLIKCIQNDCKPMPYVETDEKPDWFRSFRNWYYINRADFFGFLVEQKVSARDTLNIYAVALTYYKNQEFREKVIDYLITNLPESKYLYHKSLRGKDCIVPYGLYEMDIDTKITFKSSLDNENTFIINLEPSVKDRETLERLSKAIDNYNNPIIIFRCLYIYNISDKFLAALDLECKNKLNASQIICAINESNCKCIEEMIMQTTLALANIKDTLVLKYIILRRENVYFEQLYNSRYQLMASIAIDYFIISDDERNYINKSIKSTISEYERMPGMMFFKPRSLEFKRLKYCMIKQSEIVDKYATKQMTESAMDTDLEQKDDDKMTSDCIKVQKRKVLRFNLILMYPSQRYQIF